MPNQNTTKSCTKREEGKILVTGDDVLIEYVSRLIKALRGSAEDRIAKEDKSAIERFVTHYVWHTPDLGKTDNRYF